MFGQFQFGRANELGDVDDQLLFLRFAVGSLRSDHVLLFVLEVGIDDQILCFNPGFFFEFPKSTFHVRFPWVHMAFGQVPAIGVLEQ